MTNNKNVLDSLQHQRFCQANKPSHQFAFSLILSYVLLLPKHSWIIVIITENLHKHKTGPLVSIIYWRTKWISGSRQEEVASGLRQWRIKVLGWGWRGGYSRTEDILFSQVFIPSILWCQPLVFFFGCSWFCLPTLRIRNSPLSFCLSAGMVMRQHPLW